MPYPMSRTPSSTTVTQSRLQVSTSRQPFQRAFRGSGSSIKRPAPPTRPVEASQDDDEYALGHEGASDSESEDEPSAVARNKPSKRLPTGKKPASKPEKLPKSDDDDEDGSSGGYLPFAAMPKTTKGAPIATLEEPAKPRTPSAGKAKAKEERQDSSASSASSAQPQPSSESNASQRPGLLSPAHRAQLANLSPRSRGTGSDGSPSMSSSFSDLDDTSVTRSALEEALLSNIQHGGSSMASRMGSIRDALRRQ